MGFFIVVTVEHQTLHSINRLGSVFLVGHELGFYIPEDDILHSRRRENVKPYTAEELFVVVFSMWSIRRLFKKNQLMFAISRECGLYWVSYDRDVTRKLRAVTQQQLVQTNRGKLVCAAVNCKSAYISGRVLVTCPSDFLVSHKSSYPVSIN
jgi:hypothetical protein